MAKKKAVKVPATQEPKLAKPVRLDLKSSDHERLEKQASRRGLTMASLVRMIVLRELKVLENEP